MSANLRSLRCRQTVAAALALAFAGTSAAAAPVTPDSRVHELAVPLESWSVSASTSGEQTLSWPEFIHDVLAENLDYAAARYTVDMAAADAAAARLLPNPTLSLGATRDLTYHDRTGIGSDGQPVSLRQVENRSVGIDQTISLSGKRRWRIKVADETLRASAATLEDFLRNLKLDAASAYADALAAQRIVDRLRTESGYLDQLVQAQRRRLAAGDIGQADLTQTELEALRFQTELASAESDAETARYALSTFLGRARGRTDFVVTGTLVPPEGEPELGAMVDSALKTRPDLVALRHARDAARSGIALAKAARVPDIDVGVEYGYNSHVALNHPVDPTPSFHQLGLNVSIPLPLFDQGQNDVRKAQAAAEQAEAQLSAAELRAEAGIRSAFARMNSTRQRLAQYRGDIIKSADALIENRRYGYARGASSLLELIDAERNDNQLRQDYDQALVDAVKARIELERTTGIVQNVSY